MKKVGLLLLVLLLLLTGCGGGKNTSENLEDNKDKDVSTNPSKELEKDVESDKGYTFEYNGTVIVMNGKAAPILEDLGEAQDYFEAESCAFEGLDKIYTYSGFELHTYEIDGVDHVVAVVLLDDSVATKEGLYLYSNLDDALSIYGDKYTKNLGLYTYELDKSKISFLIENDEVVSIEYNTIIE